MYGAQNESRPLEASWRRWQARTCGAARQTETNTFCRLEQLLIDPVAQWLVVGTQHETRSGSEHADTVAPQWP